MNSRKRAGRVPPTRREPFVILQAPSRVEPPRRPRLRHGRVLRAARVLRLRSQPSRPLTTSRARRR